MILRTELRRSAAVVVGVGFLVSALVLLYSLSGPWNKGSAPWDEEWTGLAQWTRYLTSFLWPFVLAAGAWQGMRDGRSRVGELFAATPKAGWRRVLPTAGAMALMLTAAYVVLLAVGGVQVARTAAYVHLKWLPVAGVMVLALVAFALVGMGLGRLLPSPVVPPVLAVGALAMEAAAQTAADDLRLLSPSFSAADVSVFMTMSVPVTLTQALWFAGLGATGFCLLVARRRVLALLPVTLAAVVAVPVLSTVAEPVVPDLDARALVCDDNGPRVCVTRAHADLLPTVTGPAREALALSRKLPSPPTSAVEVGPADYFHDFPPPPAGVLPMYLMERQKDPARIRVAILAGFAMPTCAPNREYSIERFVDQVVMASWLDGELARPPAGDEWWQDAQREIDRGWQALRALPAAEQRTRVTAIRDEVFRCWRG